MNQMHYRTLSLPLHYGENTVDLIPVFAALYNVEIDAADYEANYVGFDEDGKLLGKLINKGTGVVEWVVEHTEEPAFKVFTHPKKLQHENITRYSSIFINTEQELDFLKGVSVGIPYDGGMVGNDAARILMQLMNNYQIGTGWSCNPGRGNTTAGFRLLHFGAPDTIPSEYIINPEVKLVAIVELETYAGRAVYSLSVGKV